MCLFFKYKTKLFLEHPVLGFQGPETEALSSEMKRFVEINTHKL